MSFVVTNAVLATAVANAGTVTLAYPAGTNQAFFTGANAAANTGAVVLNGNEVYPEASSGVRINLTYGASDITLTNNTGITWPAGSTLRVQLGRAGNDRPGFVPNPAITSLTTTVGTAADTIADGTGAYSQSVTNNNNASLARKINEILVALRTNGIISG